MQTVFQKALELIMSGDRELCNILLVTAKMSLTSSLISLLIGVPVGLWLGTCKFPGNSVLVIINRTLMGCRLLFAAFCFIFCFPAWDRSGGSRFYLRSKS